MNPIEWLIFAAALQRLRHPGLFAFHDAILAAVRVTDEGYRRTTTLRYGWKLR